MDATRTPMDEPEPDRPVTVPGVLFPDPVSPSSEGRDSVSASFRDLNLDQIVASVTAGKEEYDLAPFFRRPLQDANAIVFRQEVMRDLERSRLFDAIACFAEALRIMRGYLSRAEDFHCKLQEQRRILSAMETYCAAVVRLATDLTNEEPAARGLSAFLEYLNDYIGSADFTAFRERVTKLVGDLAAIRYVMRVRGLGVELDRHQGQADYGAEVQALFARFNPEPPPARPWKASDVRELNHVEIDVLDRVAELYPQIFRELDDCVAAQKDFADPAILAFDREVQFYLSWLQYLAPLRNAGLDFCYPVVTATSKEVFDEGGFDLALAARLAREGKLPVRNDFYLRDPERIVVVSGPNQGGKTTFARTVGQLHYLASLGCPVPGRRARLFLCDRLFTHFEKEESVDNLRSKLQDDLIRVHGILAAATPQSIVILNEIFTSTTVNDALELSKRIMTRLMRQDILCVWVTFLDELTLLGDPVVSMMSTVVPDNPAQRTYKILRRPADGLAHALAIAEKYRVTYPALKERIDS
ncbi:MAG: MutS-related protein [Gammaproteobacteria bacterium]